MNITSTRKVSTSLSYAASVKDGYEAPTSRQSFVETIDTTNNVSVGDEAGSRGGKYFNRHLAEYSEPVMGESVFSEEETVNNGLLQNKMSGPLLDNDDLSDSVSQNRSVGIYDTNQAISSSEEGHLSNPYLKYFYENNEIIEDIDEFV